MEQTSPFGDLKSGVPPWVGAIFGLIAGVFYGMAGFFFLRISHGEHMGGMLFLALPFLVGATIALVTPRAFSSAALLCRERSRS